MGEAARGSDARSDATPLLMGGTAACTLESLKMDPEEINAVEFEASTNLLFSAVFS
jgi:hypothetical protein